MRNKLLFSTALVAAAFAASNALADDEYKEYGGKDNAVISADDLGHKTSDTRISFVGDATLEKDVTMGNFVTLHEKTKLDGGKKLTVTGYLTQTASGSDISGIDLEMKKGDVTPSSSGDAKNEGELVLGNDLKVGNVNMTEGTGIWLNGNSDHSLTIADSKELTFNDKNYIKGKETDAKLKIDGKGTVVNNGNLNIETALESAAKIINNGDILAGEKGLNITMNGGYESDGGYIGNKTLTEGTSTIAVKGDINLDNNARIVAANTSDAGSVKISEAKNITLTNGSTIDAVTLEIDGGDQGTTINISGNNAAAGREGENNEKWRNNAYILGYGDSSIKNATINLGNGGHLISGNTGGGTSADGSSSMKLANSTVNLAEGSMLIATGKGEAESSFEIDNSILNLNGGAIKAKLNKAADAAALAKAEADAKKFAINVNSAASTIEKAVTGLDELNINTDTTSSDLLKAEVKTAATNVNGNFTIDKAEKNNGKLTSTDLNVNKGGTVKIDTESTNYAVTNTNVNNGGTLDVGTNSYTSDVTMNEGSTLSLTVAKGENGVVNGNIASGVDNLKIAGNSNLQVVINDDADLSKETSLDLGAISSALTDDAQKADKKLTLADNFIYDLSVNGETGEVTAVKEDAAGVADNAVKAGASANAAGTISAFALVDGLSGQGKAVHDFINTSMQKGDAASAAQLAEDVAPSAAPVVQTVETGIMNQAYGAVSSQLSGGHVASAAQGKSSGDGMFNKAAAWVRTLFNKSELDDTSKAKGFDVETTGVALGFHKEVAENVKAGVAYAYGDTSVDGHHRDTDVDSHTFMLYGEYKPSDWYVNAIASYGMSDYDESKHTAVGKIKGSYDVETYGLQAMTGYDFNVNGYTLTPEAGLRYAHIKQDSYRDSAGQRISSDNQDILTGIAGVKASKDFALDNGMKLRPEARLAMTYDLMDGENDAIVNIGSASYRINGEQLDRFGIEAGAGLTAELNEEWDVSAGYEGKFRDDFTDHTGILSAKYKF